MGYIPDWIKREIEELRRAPFGATTLVVLGVALGAWGASKFYAQEIVVLKDQLGANPASQAASAAPQASDVIQAWSGGSSQVCQVKINGGALAEFASKYDVLMLCGFNRDGIDRVTDRAITVSKPYSIDTADFDISTPLDKVMTAALAEAATNTPRPVVAPGTQLAITVALWYEAVLIPKGIDTVLIHSLADVERIGGKRLPATQRRGSQLSMPIQ